MGLNINYSLFMEGKTSPYNIDDYNKYYVSEVYSMSNSLTMLREFNNTIREARNELKQLSNSEISLNESFGTTIVNAISAIIAKIKNAIIDILRFLNKVLNSAIAKLEAKNSKDEIDGTYKPSERVELLGRALSKTEASDVTVKINSIIPTKDLLDPKFPDISIISGDFINSTASTLYSYTSNILLKDGSDPLSLSGVEGTASTDFANWIESIRDEIMRNIFGKYSYDPTNVMGSAIAVAREAFGGNDTTKIDIPITQELYMRACENLEETGIAKEIKKTYNDISKHYKNICNKLDRIKNDAINITKLSTKNYSVDMKKDYHEASNYIINNVNRALNVVYTAINASFTIFTNKVRRICDIYGNSGDSATIKRKAHFIITKYIFKDVMFEEIYNGREHSNEAFAIQENMNIVLELINEAFEENEYNENLYRYLHEEEAANNDGGNGAAEGQGADTSGNESNNNNTSGVKNTVSNLANKAKNIAGDSKKILEWLSNMIKRLTDTMTRFKARFGITIDKPFWDKNKDKISQLQISNTKVGDWHDYRLDLFKNSSFVKFDINKDYMKSDEAFQNEVLKNIYPTALPKFPDGFSFSQKVSYLYQGAYINKNEGTPIKDTGYNHARAFEFVDNIISKGFVGEYLKPIESDSANITKDQNMIKNTRDQLIEDLKAKNKNSGNQQPQPHNASAIEEDDFRFNLAECLGLMYNEAKIMVSNDEAQGVEGETSDPIEKELNSMIRRCFNYNIVATTSRMTNVIAAYKQYIELYQELIDTKPKPNKPEPKSKKNNKNNRRPV